MVDVDRIRDRLDASTWTGIGVLGLLVFVIGVGFPYLPASKSVLWHAWLPIVLAVVGGCIAALGLGFAYDLRGGTGGPKQPPKPAEADGRSVAGAPSFEIYHPGGEVDSGDRPS
jgi:hypothetical protein